MSPQRSLTPTSTDVERLAVRLRDLADEVEAAARVGVPIPYMFNVTGHPFGTASFSATAEEFDAWVAYTEAAVEKYDYAGKQWRKARVDVNGLPMDFVTSELPPHPRGPAEGGGVVSGRGWRPGDVAMRVGNGEESLAMFVGSCPTHATRHPHWHTVRPGGFGDWDTDSYDGVTYRPLVVIDPEDPETFRSALEQWTRHTFGYSATEKDRDNFADALRSLVTPPRPDEPGTWGVVEASCVHTDDRQTWVRRDDDNWYPLGGGPADDWDSLKEPVVIREGVIR